MPPSSLSGSMGGARAGLPRRATRRHSVQCFHSSSKQRQGQTRSSGRQSGPNNRQVEDGTTELRQAMFKWLHGPGRHLRQPLEGSTNYLGAYSRTGQLNRTSEGGGRRRDLAADKAKESREEEELGEPSETGSEKKSGKDAADDNALPPETNEDLRPYPLNKHFRSQPVLSEEFREEIWRRVTEQGEDVKVVSVSMGVTMERVAAVVRMKEIEKRWQREGKPLATPYSKAVMAMLPKTPFNPAKKPTAHESINDLQVHPFTKTQLFQPVPESRTFTRTDASRAFDDELLPADKRIPHPQLVEMEKDIIKGLSEQERIARATNRMQKENEKRQKAAEWRLQKQERETKVVRSTRWDFVFREVNAEAAGKDGRGEKGVGWRYGVPHEDRKRGQVKIPTRVL